MFDVNGIGLMAAILFIDPTREISLTQAAEEALELANAVTRAAVEQNAKIDAENAKIEAEQRAKASVPQIFTPEGEPATSSGKPNLKLVR